MKQHKIGIIKEGKQPIDRRVPFIPAQAGEIIEKFKNAQVACQRSSIRCFQDNEYGGFSIPLVDDVSDCDILMGVKEVPIDELIPEKTYFFFSHTIKEQPYNRALLQAVLAKKIRLIDYETLTDQQGSRIVAFGRYAGIVGAYNGLWTFGKRYNLFHLKRANECFDLEELKKQFDDISLPAIKIAITGGGRVAKGAMEVMYGAGIKRVSPQEFLEKEFHEPVFAQLNSRDYHKRTDGSPYHRSEFYQQPGLYEGDFLKFAEHADLLIASAYWDPKSPVLFKREDILNPGFKIKVIADITCDIEGSIPSTKKPSTIDDPIYDYNPSDDAIEAPFKDEGNITVMAVDNLPCELPRDASKDFGRELIDNVLPGLLVEDKDGVIARATIAENGQLTERYKYLEGYVSGK